jgi:hypothetical protein
MSSLTALRLECAETGLEIVLTGGAGVGSGRAGLRQQKAASF